MMKNLLSIIITLFLLVSCSHDTEVSPSTDGVGMKEMTFELETDELMDTRSVDGIAHIDQLYYAIWDNAHGEMLIGPSKMDNVDFSSGKFSIKVMLLGDDEYTAYFWAQSSLCGDAYHFFEDSKTVSVSYENILNNDPKYDAFFGKASFKGNDSKSKVLMTRPFALVSLMTSLQNWEALVAQGKEIEQSAVTIKGIGEKWNVDTDEISDLEDVTFDLADIPEGNVSIGINQYKLLAQCYVLAPVQPTKHEVTFKLKNEENEIILKGPIKDIPIQRNNRTNIVYNLSAEVVGIPDLKGIFESINNGNLDENVLNEYVNISIQDNTPHVKLLKDLTITGALPVLEEVHVNLDGHNLSSLNGAVFEVGQGGSLYIDGTTEGSGISMYANNGSGRASSMENEQSPAVLIRIAEGTCIITGGNYNTSTHGAGITNVPYASIVAGEGSVLTINDANIRAFDDQGGAVSAILVEERATFTGTDCVIEADSKRGLAANAIYSYGDVTLTRCKVIGKSDHTANAAGNNYGTTSRAVLAEAGSLVVNDCYVYGMHSGMTVKCDLTVNGGTYDGYSHGGIYFAAQGKTARIYNAKLNDAPLLEGYIDDGVAGTNHAGMYIGGARNMKVYMDNCDIYGYSQPIVMKDNAATSYLYISNSKMNKDYTHRGIRNDNSNYVYFGKGNEFGSEVLEYKRNYQETSDEYNANYFEE